VVLPLRIWHVACDSKGNETLQPAKTEKGNAMKMLTHSQTNRSENDGGHFLPNWVRVHRAQIIESCWFCLTFVLFLLMGPFSVIAVLVGLRSLASEENRDRMIEPAKL
jgi:hypothetical protein